MVKIETKAMMKILVVNFLMIRVSTLAVWGRGGVAAQPDGKSGVGKLEF